ncbi:MAG: isochorismatase family protein [Bdellovibrionales bacterium]
MVDCVHLSVDLDESNLCHVRETRRKQLISDARCFADVLRKRGVPTIWVAFPKGNANFILMESVVSWPSGAGCPYPQKHLRSSGVAGINIKKDEDVFVKGAEDAFQDGFLAHFIREKYGACSVVVTGGTTTICVLATLRGAQKAGFSCHVLYDRLYTLAPWDLDPCQHRDYLLQSVSLKDRSRFLIGSSRQFLQSLPESSGGRGERSSSVALSFHP